MIRRCYDKRFAKYKRYGARGITVCPEWLGEDGFIAFKKWALLSGYSDDLTIERIDIDKGYSVHRVYSAFHVLMYIVSGSLNCDIGLGYRRRSRQAVILFLTAGGIHKYHAEITHPYNVVPSSA